MKNIFFLAVILCGVVVLISSCKDDDDCTEITWFQDVDGDGLGNADVSQQACEQPEGYVSNNTDTNDSGETNTLHKAFDDFDSENFTIYVDGDEFVIETNGLPNHTSPYWSSTNVRCLNGPMGMRCTNEDVTTDHPLYVDPTVAVLDRMSPGSIDNFSGSYTLRIPTKPVKAPSSTATGLGAIGFAVSGSVIYNDEEGPNIPLEGAVASLDYTAAHTGPMSYHYHCEPKAWSDDDDKLIGIMADGFFLYGRKCNSTGDYPADLDESGGHISSTQHSDEEEYHYHIINELYLGEYYILFPNDFQGTPINIQ